jgi:hypothetical protein
MFGIGPEHVKKRPWLIDSAYFLIFWQLVWHSCASIFFESQHDEDLFRGWGEIFKCLDITLALVKGCLSKNFWGTGPKMQAVSLGKVRHDPINRRSWTFKATVSLSHWTRQNLGRYSLVLLLSFCFPIRSGGDTWQWISGWIRPGCSWTSDP